MGLFNKIALDFFDPSSSVKTIFSNIYTDTIVKLMHEDKLSRIEEKFLDCFVVQAMKDNHSL